MGEIPEARWLVVGLGNPGPEYEGTRHNVGFAVVDQLAAEARVRFGPGRFRTQVALADLSGIPIHLVKPQEFMNLSGPPVAAWLEVLGLPPERLVVAHDDLDLPLGQIRVVERASPGGHRGVDSIQAALGTSGFPRVRVGIGRPREGEDATDRVLGTFTTEEVPVITQTVERAAGAMRSLICEGLASARDRYNVRVAPEVDPSH